MFAVGVAQFSLLVHRGPLQAMYCEYRKRAKLVEEFDLDSPEGEACFIAAGLANEWPTLVVAQRFEPCGPGFTPGVLLVPETRVLSIGAGRRLLAYSLNGPSRLWEDSTDFAFWSWNRHEDFVLMSAELELAAWDLNAKKLWSVPVEPPWEYRVEDGKVHLSVTGAAPVSFSIADGFRS